jgi:hypothetical protein
VFLILLFSIFTIGVILSSTIDDKIACKICSFSSSFNPLEVCFTFSRSISSQFNKPSTFSESSDRALFARSHNQITTAATIIVVGFFNFHNILKISEDAFHDKACLQTFARFKAHLQNLAISFIGFSIYLTHSFFIKYISAAKKPAHKANSIGLSILGQPSRQLIQVSFIIIIGHISGSKRGAFSFNQLRNQSLFHADSHKTQIYGKLQKNHLINSGNCLASAFNLPIFSVYVPFFGFKNNPILSHIFCTLKYSKRADILGNSFINHLLIICF